MRRHRLTWTGLENPSHSSPMPLRSLSALSSSMPSCSYRTESFRPFPVGCWSKWPPGGHIHMHGERIDRWESSPRLSVSYSSSGHVALPVQARIRLECPVDNNHKRPSGRESQGDRQTHVYRIFVREVFSNEQDILMSNCTELLQYIFGIFFLKRPYGP